ncbi:AraC family transcriptional regulator [Halopseudomonas pachastrellae]|nr:AraC family transcriptional regulator [Halopseudomonas pachastrellae]
MPGLILLRRSSPAAVDHAIVQPLLCLVLEGSKEVDIDQRTERYNAGDFMLVARNTPTLTRIAGASVAAPYMSIALDLNIGLLGELIELHHGAPASPPQDTRAPLLDAMRRLISLLDDPTSLAALGTGLLREIHHWLLLGPEGLQLREMAQTDGHGPAYRPRGKVVAQRLPQPAVGQHPGRQRRHEPFGLSSALSRVHVSDAPAISEAPAPDRRARNQMLGRGKSISAAAFAVGYESASQFSREYRRLFGLSPAQDRKANPSEPAKSSAG